MTDRISYRPSRVPGGKAMVGADYKAAGFGPDRSRHQPVERRPVLPRSLQRPVASTEGSLTENLNKTEVRLWTGCPSSRRSWKSSDRRGLASESARTELEAQTERMTDDVDWAC